MTEARMTDASRPRKIILHCGAPKTGSTSLQHFLRDAGPALMRAGIVCPPRFIAQGNVDPLHLAFVAMRNPRATGQAIKRGRVRLDELFADDRVKTVLVSNESVLGEPFFERNPHFFPDLASSVDALTRLFDGYEVEVRYFIRDLADYVPSYYVQHVRRGLSWSLKRYAESLDQDSLSWQPVVACLKAAFGAEKVRVFDHAALVAEPAATVKRVFGRFAPDLPAFVAADYQKNQSVGATAILLYRGMNWLFDRTVPAKYKKNARVRMRRMVFEPLGKLLPGGKPGLRPGMAATLKARFQADKAALGL